MSPGPLTETCRCPLCHEDLGPLQVGRLVCCGTCNTPYHRPCYRELGGCATLGCTNRRPRLTLRVRPSPQVQVDDPRTPQLLAGVSVFAAMLAIAVAVFAWDLFMTPYREPPIPEHLQGAHKIKRDDGDRSNLQPWERLERRKLFERPARTRAATNAEASLCARAGHAVGCRHARVRPRFALTAPVDDRLHVPR